MPLEQVIANFTGTGFATLPPVIPGLTALGFFGSTMGGNNGNRVSDGPAFSNLTSAPDIGTAWITVNAGTQTPTKGYDSGVVETSGIRDGGWTMFCVARMTAGAGQAGLVSTTGTFCDIQISPSFGLNSNRPAVWHSQQAFSFDPATAMIDLGSASVASWRMYALGYASGTVSRPYTVFDVTGNVQTITNNAAIRATNGHFLFGQPGNTVPAAYVAANLACAGVCTQLLTLAQLRTVRTWLLGVEAMRLVTGF